MENSSQLLKGVLEGCILSIISEGETYGYELSQKLERAGLSMVSEGSIYPALLRIQKQGLVTSTIRPSPAGPDRKYYTITPAGELALARFVTTFRQVSLAVETLSRRVHGRCQSR